MEMNGESLNWAKAHDASDIAHTRSLPWSVPRTEHGAQACENLSFGKAASIGGCGEDETSTL